MPFFITAILMTFAIGTATWFISINAFIGYAIGVTTGTISLLALIRNLAKKQRYSAIATIAFSKLTRCKPKIYHIHVRGEQDKNATAKVYTDDHEYADLLNILRQQMQLPLLTARQLAKSAIEEARGKPLEDKIRVALQHWGNGHG